MKLLSTDFFREASQFVAVEARAPQPLFPLHEHDFHEIVIVASGNGWHVLNDEPHFLSCAEILYLETGDRHSFEEVHDLYLTNILYRQNGSTLHPERIQPYLQPTDSALGEHRYWQISEDVLHRLSPLLAALATESRKTDPASELLAESLFVQLIVALWRDRFAVDGERLRPSGRVAQALCYLRHNCTEPLDLDEVAHRFGFSSRNFRRVLRDATATSPHDYLVKLRLAHAMRALRASDQNITDIALASGFNDSNYFARAFTKLIGVSPSRYRELTQRAAQSFRRVASTRS